jgi:membrane-bound metal-dependent hydrolase YbcI (DUF457 family)
MPLPPAHVLVGAGAAELTRSDRQGPRRRLWLFGGALGVLPDLDTGIGVLLGRGTEFHGIFTHTLLAVLAVAALTWAIGGRRWAVVAAAAYGSHLLIDLLEDRQGTSVQPWWPLSDERLSSVAPVFPNVPWRHGAGPEGAALSLFDPEVLPWLVAQTAVGALVLLLAVLLRRMATVGRRRSAP